MINEPSLRILIFLATDLAALKNKQAYLMCKLLYFVPA